MTSLAQEGRRALSASGHRIGGLRYACPFFKAAPGAWIDHNTCLTFANPDLTSTVRHHILELHLEWNETFSDDDPRRIEPSIFTAIDAWVEQDQGRTQDDSQIWNYVYGRIKGHDDDASLAIQNPYYTPEGLQASLASVVPSATGAGAPSTDPTWNATVLKDLSDLCDDVGAVKRRFKRLFIEFSHGMHHLQQLEAQAGKLERVTFPEVPLVPPTALHTNSPAATQGTGSCFSSTFDPPYQSPGLIDRSRAARELPGGTVVDFNVHAFEVRAEDTDTWKTGAWVREPESTPHGPLGAILPRAPLATATSASALINTSTTSASSDISLE